MRMRRGASAALGVIVALAAPGMPTVARVLDPDGNLIIIGQRERPATAGS